MCLNGHPHEAVWTLDGQAVKHGMLVLGDLRVQVVDGRGGEAGAQAREEVAVVVDVEVRCVRQIAQAIRVPKR